MAECGGSSGRMTTGEDWSTSPAIALPLEAASAATCSTPTNDFNQVTTEYQQHGSAVNTGTSPKVQYAYANGSTNTIRRNSVTYPAGEVLSYTYSSGADDKLSRVGKLSWDSTEVVDYAYLGLGQVVIQKYTEPADDVEYTLDHGTANAYAGMDRFGRIVDLQWLQNTNERVRLKYGYDRASNRLYRRDEVARTNSAKFDELYAYDGLNRLDDFDRGELNANNNGFVGATTLGQEWTLDETGNWKTFKQTVADALTQTRTHNTVNEITDIGETQGTSWPTPVYDNNGNTTTMPQPGALGSSYTAKYDAWNRLVEISDTGGVVASYEYDGLNRRTIRTENSTTTHFYYSDSWQCLEERLGTATTADKQYVWGVRYVDDLVLSDKGANRYYYCQDANWNVVAALNTSGAVQERYAYTPYGVVEYLTNSFGSSSSSSISNEFLYIGRRLDPETEIYYYRNRYYHAQLGRFLTRDPIGYEGVSFNLYEYVHGSPINLTDPTGEVAPQAIYWGIRIGLAVTSTLATLSWANSGSKDFDSVLGRTDLGELPNTSFDGSPGGESSNKRPCPKGSGGKSVFGEGYYRYYPWNSRRRLLISLDWDYSGGSIQGRFRILAQGTAPSVGFRVQGITISVSEKEYHCECLKYVPCFTGTIQIRTVLDQPWPINNVDESKTIKWGPICADGTGDDSP